MKPVSQLINAGILLVFFFTGGFVQAQKKEYIAPEEFKKISVSLAGGGGGFFNGNVGLSGHIGLQYNIKNNFIKLQAGSLTTLGLFETDYNTALDIGLLYGLSHRAKKWKLSAAAGVGYYNYETHINAVSSVFFSSSNADYKTTSRQGVGFPVNGSVIFQPRRFGIGLQLNANFNSVKSYGTFGVVYTFRF